MNKLWYLKHCDLFSGLSKEEIDKVMAVATDRNVPKKEIIYRPGDSGVMFITKKGKVRFFKLSPEGKMITLDILKEGDIFGDIAEIKIGTQGAYAETLEDSYVCAIRQNDFHKLIQDMPEVAMRLISKINQKLEEAEERIADLVFRDVPARLASIILKLAERFGKDNLQGQEIDFRITHQELADMVGASRETVTIILNEFKSDDVLKIEDKKIIIINKKMLKELAGRE